MKKLNVLVWLKNKKFFSFNMKRGHVAIQIPHPDKGFEFQDKFLYLSLYGDDFGRAEFFSRVTDYVNYYVKSKDYMLFFYTIQLNDLEYERLISQYSGMYSSFFTIDKKKSNEIQHSSLDQRSFKDKQYEYGSTFIPRRINSSSCVSRFNFPAGLSFSEDNNCTSVVYKILSSARSSDFIPHTKISLFLYFFAWILSGYSIWEVSELFAGDDGINSFDGTTSIAALIILSAQLIFFMAGLLIRSYNKNHRFWHQDSLQAMLFCIQLLLSSISLFYDMYCVVSGKGNPFKNHPRLDLAIGLSVLISILYVIFSGKFLINGLVYNPRDFKKELDSLVIKAKEGNQECPWIYQDYKEKEEYEKDFSIVEIEKESKESFYLVKNSIFNNQNPSTYSPMSIDTESGIENSLLA